MKKKSFKKMALTLLTVILIMSLILFFIFPIKGWVVESPGHAEPLTEIVTVNGKSEKYRGDLMLTTVRLRQATPYLWLKSKVDEFTQLEKQEEVMGKANNEEYAKLQKYYMETSENNAKAVALKLAHKQYHFQFQGIYVLSIDKQSPFKKKLKVGDLITAFNDKKFATEKDALSYIKKQKVGQNMTLTIQRHKKTMKVTAPLMKMKETNQAGIGIALVTKSSVASKEKIKIDAGDIGGPSAGLMFTLQLYELLTGTNLQQGKEIAGTGEVSRNGEVLRIGGIQDKVAAAEKEGAQIFLAPDDEITKEMKQYDKKIKSNYEEAKAIAKEKGYRIKVVPIKTVKQAIQYLQ